MRDFTLDNLTDIVLQERESKTPPPRFRKIITWIISHREATDPDGQPIAGAKLDV